MNKIDPTKTVPRHWMGYTCSLCGHRGFDVSYHWDYVGGQGEIRQLYCDDRVACWRRMEKQNEDRLYNHFIPR